MTKLFCEICDSELILSKDDGHNYGDYYSCPIHGVMWGEHARMEIE